jgi:hypothetical protein
LLRSCSSFSGNDDPNYQIGYQPRQAARQQKDQEQQAKPPGVNTKEGPKSAANPSNNAVLSSQLVFLF